MKICDIYGRPPTLAYHLNVPGEAIFGVELEIEAVPAEALANCPALTMYKEDGSLRNNGWEFVTYPLHYTEVMEQVRKVLSYFRHDVEEHFSERTSCHVHVNVGDMESTQLAAMLLAYQVVERMMFDFVKGDRDKNIFCVPLAECANTYRAATRLENGLIENVISSWRKYTAFNLCRIPDLCTVEFRHMPGTPSVEKIGTWIKMIKSLRDFAFKYNYQELKARINSLNTSSAYMSFAADVLGGGADLPWWNYQQHAPMLEDGVLTAKFSLISDAKQPVKLPKIDLANWRNDRQWVIQGVAAPNPAIIFDDLQQPEDIR